MLPLREVVKTIVPDRLHGTAKDKLDDMARPVRARYYRGKARYCPICEHYSRTFLAYGLRPKPIRPDVRCPNCGSLERHRVMWIFLKERTDLFTGGRKRLLHIAPERVFADRFSADDAIDYLSGDLDASRAMRQLDVTDLDLPDDTFDAALCSHVLEHVPDDRRAMREIWRVLKPGGWAIMQAPIGAQVTYEDPAIRTPAERKRVYGQEDHVRIYGADYVDRLREAGFEVTIDEFASVLPQARIDLMRLNPRERIFFCRKD